jgi:steroid delta-isomerase-like uncharacterized protein
MPNVADIIKTWVSAANSHDPERLASLYSPRAQLLYTWGELLNGQQSINQHFAEFFRAFPTWQKEPYSLIKGDDDWGVLEWQAHATFDGPYHDAAPTGRSFQVRGVGVFHVVDGRIHLHRRYLDRRDWFRQMGIR